MLCNACKNNVKKLIPPFFSPRKYEMLIFDIKVRTGILKARKSKAQFLGYFFVQIPNMLTILWTSHLLGVFLKSCIFIIFIFYFEIGIVLHIGSRICTIMTKYLPNIEWMYRVFKNYGIYLICTTGIIGNGRHRNLKSSTLRTQLVMPFCEYRMYVSIWNTLYTLKIYLEKPWNRQQKVNW